MNATSVNAPRGVSEFDYANLTAAPCEQIQAPRVAEAYASLECVAVDIRQLKGRDGALADAYMVIGEVVGVHIDETILVDGLIDITKSRPVTRLGYMDFATTTEVYQMFRPKWGE
jgi:flavin reductase (DIM6/NTAB) family NADH-FMN oxidoreductase RutF